MTNLTLTTLITVHGFTLAHSLTTANILNLQKVRKRSYRTQSAYKQAKKSTIVSFSMEWNCTLVCIDNIFYTWSMRH